MSPVRDSRSVWGQGKKRISLRLGLCLLPPLTPGHGHGALHRVLHLTSCNKAAFVSWWVWPAALWLLHHSRSSSTMAASNFSRHGCGRKHERNAAQKALCKWFACGLLKLGNSCGLQPQRSYFYSLIATTLFPLALIKCDLFILIWSLDIKDKFL